MSLLKKELEKKIFNFVYNVIYFHVLATFGVITKLDIISFLSVCESLKCKNNFGGGGGGGGGRAFSPNLLVLFGIFFFLCLSGI